MNRLLFIVKSGDKNKCWHDGSAIIAATESESGLGSFSVLRNGTIRNEGFYRSATRGFPGHPRVDFYEASLRIKGDIIPFYNKVKETEKDFEPMKIGGFDVNFSHNSIVVGCATVTRDVIYRIIRRMDECSPDSIFPAQSSLNVPF